MRNCVTVLAILLGVAAKVTAADKPGDTAEFKTFSTT